MNRGPLAFSGAEVSDKEFARCWNDPDTYPLRRLEVRWRCSTQTIRRRAHELRQQGYQLITRRRWDG